MCVSVDLISFDSHGQHCRAIVSVTGQLYVDVYTQSRVAKKNITEPLQWSLVFSHSLHGNSRHSSV